MQTPFRGPVLGITIVTLVVGGCDRADSPGPKATEDTGTTPTTPLTSAEPPCADGSWGRIEASTVAEAIHVRADGSDDGDGSAAAPLASFDAAVALSRDGGLRRIALGPGSYETTFTLSADDGDDGLVIEGCGPDEVSLVAADDEEHVLRITGAEDLDLDVELRGFTLEGGRRTLWIWRGASVTIDALTVRDGTRLGVVMDGSNTGVVATDLEVHDIAAGTSGLGYGIAIQSAQVTLIGGGVWGGSNVGIFIHDEGASVDFEGVSVDGTLSDSSGSMGRGIHVQGQAEGRFTDCLLSGNSDAGFFALASYWLEVDGLEVTGTQLADVPDSSEQSGEGIVITQGDRGESVSTYRASVVNSVVSGSARAGILFDGTTATELSGNSITGSGYADGGAVLIQGGADASAALDETVNLSSPLGINLAELATDPLTD